MAISNDCVITINLNELADTRANFLGLKLTDDQIDAYIDLKMEEVNNFQDTPHPIEYEMYYSC